MWFEHCFLEIKKLMWEISSVENVVDSANNVDQHPPTNRKLVNKIQLNFKKPVKLKKMRVTSEGG